MVYSIHLIQPCCRCGRLEKDSTKGAGSHGVHLFRDVDAASYQKHLISEESGTTFPSSGMVRQRIYPASTKDPTAAMISNTHFLSSSLRQTCNLCLANSKPLWL